MPIRIIRAVLCTALVLLTSTSKAQEPALQLLADGPLVIGIVTQADGRPAAGISLQLLDTSLSQNEALTLTTDQAGVFVFAGEALRDYRASAVLDGRTINATVRTGEGPSAPLQWPPIYVTLGLLMLLSLIPARMLRRKDL